MRISFAISAKLLKADTRFSDQIRRLRSGDDSFDRQGTYHFVTHTEANRHQMNCLTVGMAKLVHATTHGSA